jgi:hypothetical protein
MEWQKRLYEHEQAPPPALWPALLERLQKGPGRLAGKFTDYEAVPPEDAWPAISQSIHRTDRQGKGILRRLVGWTIPAAAASLAYLTIRLFSPASSSVVLPVSTALSRVSKVMSEDSPSDPVRNDSRKDIEPQVRGVSQVSNGSTIPARARPVDAPRDANYLQVCDSSRVVCNRINYKLEGMAQYIHAKGAMAVSDPCNRELQEWVDRMEHSAYVPAPGHFFDIVELAASLIGDR